MRNLGTLFSFVILGTLLRGVDAAPRNIVLFVTDDQGRDAGCYGNPIIQTPHLDALAANGTRCDYAFCTTASCSASRSVILTGMHNHRNRQYGHQHAYHHFRSDRGISSLPQLLSQAGYQTARVGKYHVGPEEVYPFDRVLNGNARNPVAMADSCGKFLSETDDRPFFLYFCTADPHRGGGSAQDLPHAPDRFGNRPDGFPGIDTTTYDPRDVIVPDFLPDTPACRAELAQYYESVSRVDQGLGRLVRVLQEAGVWEETLFVYISDHGIAFPGAKTTVYEPGLRSPCIVRNPYQETTGNVSNAMISWVDITPTLLDFASLSEDLPDFHGRSFLDVLDGRDTVGWDEIYASHTFHEITMYYPMRVVRGRRYKLIWNIAHPLPYPFASDLWAAPTWQDVYEQGPAALYGMRSVQDYIHRPEFELYDLEIDPHEVDNLATDPRHAQLLTRMKQQLKSFQQRTDDPWILKWNYE